MQKNKAIVLLINPLGNKKRLQNIIAEIISVLSKKEIAFETCNDLWPTDINVYKEVWILGGDGTVNYFLNLYKTVEIPIVIFKGGTGNDFATRLYGKLKINEQINKVIGTAPQYVDAAECNGRKFINGVGVGFDGKKNIFF